jgi:hypothetical protein
MDSNQQLVDSALDRAVAQFDYNPRCSDLIRRLAQEHREAFANAATRHLGTPGQSTALRYLAALMTREKSVFEKLSDPGPAARQRSAQMLHRLLMVDPSFDIKLAKQLPDSLGSNHDRALTGARGVRALEVLDQNSRGTRLVPILAHLVDHSDPKLSAGATLFVGKRMQNPEWVAKQLKHGDPRVRANAIESIWRVNGPGARKVLEEGGADPSNRVVGNSLIGLHALQGQGVIEQTIEMAAKPDPKFRATAAWAMGMIGAPVFYSYLAALVKDEDGMVRRAALRSLLGLRREEAARAHLAPPAQPEQGVVEEILESVEEMPFFNLRLDGSYGAVSKGF